MRKIEIIILKFSVFVFYVAFRSQLLAIAEDLERLLINFFFTKERLRLSIQTVQSLLSHVGEQKYSSDSYEFEIIEVKYQLLKQKISYGTKRKNCWVLAELFGDDVAATLPSCWHSRE